MNDNVMNINNRSRRSIDCQPIRPSGACGMVTHSWQWIFIQILTIWKLHYGMIKSWWISVILLLVMAWDLTDTLPIHDVFFSLLERVRLNFAICCNMCVYIYKFFILDQMISVTVWISIYADLVFSLLAIRKLFRFQIITQINQIKHN